MGDSPVAGACAYASSGLGGTAATGDGDIMTQVGISAMSRVQFSMGRRIGRGGGGGVKNEVIRSKLKINSPF